MTGFKHPTCLDCRQGNLGRCVSFRRLHCSTCDRERTFTTCKLVTQKRHLQGGKKETEDKHDGRRRCQWRGCRSSGVKSLGFCATVARQLWETPLLDLTTSAPRIGSCTRSPLKTVAAVRRLHSRLSDANHVLAHAPRQYDGATFKRTNAPREPYGETVAGEPTRSALHETGMGKTRFRGGRNVIPLRIYVSPSSSQGTLGGVFDITYLDSFSPHVWSPLYHIRLVRYLRLRYYSYTPLPP